MKRFLLALISTILLMLGIVLLTAVLLAPGLLLFNKYGWPGLLLGSMGTTSIIIFFVFWDYHK